ncbi:DUF2306 domain-containing protein [Nesterenkonia sp. CF4.4]|uniref:DUF2306 domain-containing protein n=1 Tax=Nesterenkonia sp. CF4.4 TaxID=3373079 RepID=UPI003EE65060
MEPWTALIAVHAFFAAFALLLGGFQLLRPRKGDRWHVYVGRVWMVGIAVTSLSAFWIGGYSTFMELFLKTLAVISIASIAIAWWRLKKGDIAKHAGFMTGAYLGLVGAFIGVIVVPERRIPNSFRIHTEEAIFATLIIVVIAASVIGVARVVALSRMRRQRTTVGDKAAVP